MLPSLRQARLCRSLKDNQVFHLVRMYWACRVSRSDGTFTALTTRGWFSFYAYGWHLSLVVSRRFDIANERLPEFDPNASPGLFPAPSTRPHMTGMEALIRRTLEDDSVDEGGVVDRIAEQIARERTPQGRPRALKRFETA